MKRFLLAVVLVLMGLLAVQFLPSEDSGPGADSLREAADSGTVSEAAQLPGSVESVERVPISNADQELDGDWCEAWVRTVDSSGKPVFGVPVGFGWSAERAHPEALGVTVAPDATARIRLPSPQPDRRRYLHALLLSEQAACTELSDPTTAEHPAQIVLPAFGKVRIEVADALSMFGQCTLERSDDAAAADHFWHNEGALWAEIEQASAEFACVTLSQRLTATLRQRRGRGQITKEFHGPMQAGEIVTVRFEPPHGAALLGRLLAEDGAPMGEAECRYRLLSEALTFGSGLITGEDGRFRIALEESSTKGAMKELILQLELPSTQSGLGFGSSVLDPSRRARIVLPAEISSEAYDLGDLVLSPSPVIVSGRVEERSGAPIAGAQVIVEALWYTDATGVQNFNDLEGAQMQTEADGSFRVYGDAPSKPLRVRCESQEFLSSSATPFAVGDERVIIVMHRAAGFEGKLLFPPGSDEFRVTLELVRTEGGEVMRQVVGVKQRLGRFILKPIAPGRYDCSLRLTISHEPFHVVSGIQVLEGESTRDPRLEDLDLAQFLTPVALRLRCQDGSAFPTRLTVSALSPDGRAAQGVGFRATDGVVSVLLANGMASAFAVRAEGFLTEYLPDLRGDTEVVLRRAVNIVLRVSGDAPLANDLGSYSLRASILEPEGIPQILAMLGQQKEYLDVGGDRSAAFHLTRTGTLVVEWLVPTTQERDGVLHSFKRLQPCVSIPVGPGDAGRVIEIPPPVLD